MPSCPARRDFLKAGLAASLAEPSSSTPAGDGIRLASREGIALGWECRVGQPMRLGSLRNQASGFEWCAAPADFSPAMEAAAGKAGEFLLKKWQQTKEAKGVTASFQFEPRRGVEAGISCRLFTEANAVELRPVFHNVGRGVHNGVTRARHFSLALRRGLGALEVHCVRRNTYAIERLPVDRELTVTGGDWNSPDHAGLLFLESTESHEFLVLAIEAEHCWEFRMREENGALAVSFDLCGLMHDMAPGERLRLPAVTLMTVRGNIDKAINAVQRHWKQNVYPPPLDGAPWVSYDIWGTEAEGVEKAIHDEIGVAADMGVELFYVDAAWYKGSSKRGTGDWGCGLGSYDEDREKYPQGLAEISRRVHARGMKFGLWVGPNIVDMRLVGNSIPERWVARWQGLDRVLRIPAWEAECRQVCLGCTGYIEHLKTNLDRIVQEFSLDWLKWDNSGIPGVPGRCDRADHGHQAGDGSYAALQGEYAVFDYLRRRHPRLVLEQCGYGSRHDIGLARLVRAHWLSDATFPAAHVRQNALVARALYPSFYNGGWIVRADTELEKASDPVVLDSLFRSRMIGLFGFGTLEGKLSERVSLFRPEVLAAARRNIPLYKRYRHLLREECRCLFPPMGSPERWQAVEFEHADGSEAVVLCFRAGSTQAAMRIPVTVTDVEAAYTVESANSGRVVRLAGGELKRNGWIVSLPNAEASEVLILRKERA